MIIEMPEQVVTAITQGDWDTAIANMPYFEMLGLRVTNSDRLQLTMKFHPGLIGNPTIPALHGGAIAGFLEATGVAKVLKLKPSCFPDTINHTVNYLAPGKPQDILGEGQIIKVGKRIVIIDVIAWQDDFNKPIATMRAQYRLNN